MKSKFLLISGLFIAAFCGVTSCSTGSTNFVKSNNKLTDAQLDCAESANYYSRECIQENPSRWMISFSQYKANLAELTESNNNDAKVGVTTSKSSPGSSVPKAFAGVVDLLNHNTPPNEPSPPITCHYSQKQQNIFASWQTKYQQLKSVATTCQTAMIDKLRTSESVSQLIGPINNPYGVRDDILEQIVKMVPESNPQMLQAAIKWAYYDNLAYYSASDIDKLKFARNAGNAQYCAYLFDHSLNVAQSSSLVKIFDSKNRDNSDREHHVNRVERIVFGWQVFTSPDKDICNEGRY